jgi:hypothetical protein
MKLKNSSGIKNMGIISSASGSSCWIGLDYYKSMKNIKRMNIKMQLSL